eukprot:5529381-Prymnesium_polylepis.1
MYFPGRNTEVDDTHARLRPKYVKLAQILDAPASNGSLVVGWMVRGRAAAAAPSIRRSSRRAAAPPRRDTAGAQPPSSERR